MSLFLFSLLYTYFSIVHYLLCMFLSNYGDRRLQSIGLTMSNKCQKTCNKEFLDAVYNGDVRTVKEMLEKHQVNVNNMCALYKATKAGHVSVVQELIKVGADMNMSHSLEGRTFTPLQAACIYRCCAEAI